jgi:hypothetical protein
MLKIKCETLCTFLLTISNTPITFENLLQIKKQILKNYPDVTIPLSKKDFFNIETTPNSWFKKYNDKIERNPAYKFEFIFKYILTSEISNYPKSYQEILWDMFNSLY